MMRKRVPVAPSWSLSTRADDDTRAATSTLPRRHVLAAVARRGLPGIIEASLVPSAIFLIVTGAVSAGAELIADGCVLAYGPLRGRAIAGARGDESSRVFCRKFEAELVAVAGIYAVADQMQGVKGFAVQAFLDKGKLKIEMLKS